MPRRQTVTFIVRLWAEYLEQVPPSWRGEIQFVGKREAVRFGNLRAMDNHIRHWVSTPLAANNVDGSG